MSSKPPFSRTESVCAQLVCPPVGISGAFALLLAPTTLIERDAGESTVSIKHDTSTMLASAILGRTRPVITREAQSNVKKRLRMAESPVAGIPVMVPELWPRALTLTLF